MCKRLRDCQIWPGYEVWKLPYQLESKAHLNEDNSKRTEWRRWLPSLGSLRACVVVQAGAGREMLITKSGKAQSLCRSPGRCRQGWSNWEGMVTSQKLTERPQKHCVPLRIQNLRVQPHFVPLAPLLGQGSASLSPPKCLEWGCSCNVWWQSPCWGGPCPHNKGIQPPRVGSRVESLRGNLEGQLENTEHSH